MKKSIMSFMTVSIIFIFCALPLSPRAYAAGGYAMIVTDDAVFYSDASGRYPKFYIDKSYFVFVTDIVGDYARINYMDGFSDSPALEGYVKTVNLSFYDKPITSPYPDIILTAVSDAVIFTDYDMSRPKSVINASAKARYFGKYRSGASTVYYVYCQGSVGYVQASAFENFSLPYHEEYIALTTVKDSTSASDEISDTSSVSSGTPETTEQVDTTKIIIIALLIVVGLTVLYFIIRPDKLSGKSKVYSDDE